MSSTATDILPISEILTPVTQAALVDAVCDCYATDVAIYPIGGGTSLDFGLPPKQDGVGLALSQLDRVVEFPVRDLTITVEAGITMQTLSDTLAQENLRLPIDVPEPSIGTLGGVVTTNFNGPRRFGQGTVRDYVIGISAVDGRGTPFKGGGRVVKNVAGYDLCKLLTGSLGTLGVITQVTLKLKPIPSAHRIVASSPPDLEAVECLLAALVESDSTPTAIELLAGPDWSQDAFVGALSRENSRPVLAISFEGTAQEVDWSVGQLKQELAGQEIAETSVISGDEADHWLQMLAEFPRSGFPSSPDAPLVLKANVVPSGTTRFVAQVQSVAPSAMIQAHAGNGTVIVRFAELPGGGIARDLVGNLDAVAAGLQGNVIMIANPSRAEMTHQSVWGGIDAPFRLMEAIKREFDPKNLLNPGRFIYQF
ncbi:MAG TPA: FAD-binding oxidoreductase [Pirellulaceae bacterium]|nr:FAD-binding oxidoreductase [Pirellulaceae bacterium]